MPTIKTTMNLDEALSYPDMNKAILDGANRWQNMPQVRFVLHSETDGKQYVMLFHGEHRRTFSGFVRSYE